MVDPDVKGANGMAVAFAKMASAMAGTAGYCLPGGVSLGMEATERSSSIR